MNPLFKQLGGMGAQMPGPMGQFQSMVQQFQKFRQSFTGDPKAEVEKLLRTGQMFQSLLGGQ